jgi:hypothetical protein
MKLESKHYTNADSNTVYIHKEPFDAIKLMRDKQYIYIDNLKYCGVAYLAFVDLDDIKIALSSLDMHDNKDCSIAYYACESTKTHQLGGMTVINSIGKDENKLFRVRDRFIRISNFAGGLLNPETIIRDETKDIKNGAMTLNSSKYSVQFAFDLTPYLLYDDSKIQRKLDLLNASNKHLKVKNGLLHADNISDIAGAYKKAKVFNSLNCLGTLCETPKDSVIIGGYFINCTVACNSRRQDSMRYKRCKVYFNKPCIVSQATFLDCEIIINAPVILHNVRFIECQLRVHDACSIKYMGINSGFDVNVKIDT